MKGMSKRPECNYRMSHESSLSFRSVLSDPSCSYFLNGKQMVVTGEDVQLHDS